jgi:phage I-like protein
MGRMKHKPSTSNFAVAVLAFEIDTQRSEIQLLPAGKFRAKDGRPTNAVHWVINREIAASVIARASLRDNPTVIDYEHQTLTAKDSGQPAPAAGWFKGADLEWREGEGLFATNVTWTTRAQEYIDNGEYRYISAVFPYRKETGEVLDIHMAAITNNPALDGMQELESRAAACFEAPVIDSKEYEMDKLTLALLTALGLNETATEEQALAALTALQSKANKLEATETAVAALKADLEKTATPDPSKFVSIEVVNALRTELATLTAEVNDGKVEALVESGIKSGKLHAAQKQWATDLGKKDIASLTSYLETSQPIAALAAMQTDETDIDDKKGDEKLTDEELAVCTATGLSPEDFLKTKNENQ